MSQSSEDLLRRLGEARQLSGARQNEAILDILQRVLQEHQEMQRYLAMARATWAGEDELPSSAPATDAPADGEARVPEQAPR